MENPFVQRRIRDGCALFLTLIVCVCVSPVEATRVRPVNLEEMTQRADRIFSGQCVDVRVVEDAELGSQVTEVTFEVDQAVKGPVGETVTIKLHGGPAGGSGDDVVGQPRFEPGEEVILFLYGESSSGFTAPVGLGQGKFTVVEDKQGRRLALNEFGNKALFRKLSEDARQRLTPTDVESSVEDSRALSPEELLRFVESLAR
jgi:hypothetical protein